MEGDAIVAMWRDAVAAQRPTPIPTPHGPVLVVTVNDGPTPMWLAGPFLMEDGSVTVAAFDSEADALRLVARYVGGNNNSN